jgi:ATP-dependent RNA helicase RhlE
MIQIERQTVPPGGITQAIYPVPQHLKTELLRKLLEHDGLESVICFTRTKHRANRLAAALAQHGISCIPIHGNRSQGQRTAALAGFKAGQYRVLVATDIAARGIDIADVSHVINFDCPHIADDYIHRVGRTGRASAVGDAFTFVSDEEQQNLRTIERAIGKRLPRITLPDFDYTQRVAAKLEIPIADRIAAIRQQKAQARSRQQGYSQQGTQGGQQGGWQGRQPGGGYSGQHGSPGPEVAAIGGARSGGHAGGGHGFHGHKPRKPGGGGGGGKFGNHPGRGRFSGPVGPR